MIALILGGAPSVFDEAKDAAAIVGPHIAVAANLAGIHWPGDLAAWASLHGDLLPEWARERRGKPAGRLFTVDRTPERWSGSSGLYALQCALFEMGAAGAVLCGVPMEAEAGHFDRAGRWEAVGDYRQAFEAALPEIGGRTRSMGGWTQRTFGAPTAEWVGAISNKRPLGLTAPEEKPMNTIKNVSDAHQSFWAMDPADGLSKLYHLDPGESVELTLADDHAVHRDPAYRVTRKSPPAPAAKARSAPKRKAASKPAKAAAPAPEPTPEPATDAEA